MFANVWPQTLSAIIGRKGLSQAQCASRSDKSEVMWSRWVRGQNRPSPQTLPAIAKGLGVSLDELGYEYAKNLFAHYLEVFPQNGGLDPLHGGLPTVKRAEALLKRNLDSLSREELKVALTSLFNHARGLALVSENLLSDCEDLHEILTDDGED